jgi:hypothetical protein
LDLVFRLELVLSVEQRPVITRSMQQFSTWRSFLNAFPTGPFALHSERVLVPLVVPLLAARDIVARALFVEPLPVEH